MSNRAEDEGWGIQRDGTGYRVVEGPYGGRWLCTPVMNEHDAMALAKLAQDRDDLLEALKAMLAWQSGKAPRPNFEDARAAVAAAEGK